MLKYNRRRMVLLINLLENHPKSKYSLPHALALAIFQVGWERNGGNLLTLLQLKSFIGGEKVLCNNIVI